MKKCLSLVLTLAIMLTSVCGASAQTNSEEEGYEVQTTEVQMTEDTDERLIERDDITKDPVHPHNHEEADEEDCGYVVVGFSPKEDKEEHKENVNFLYESDTRGTTKPNKFWNIAKDGIYRGTFEGVLGAIYTNYYFDYDEDPAGQGDYCYYVRLDVSTHLYGNQSTFEVRNYCTECGLVTTVDEDFRTPGGGESTGYIYIKFWFTTKHDGHFMYPAVVNTTSYGKINGTIDVNYRNTWN